MRNGDIYQNDFTGDIVLILQRKNNYVEYRKVVPVVIRYSDDNVRTIFEFQKPVDIFNKTYTKIKKNDYAKICV